MNINHPLKYHFYTYRRNYFIYIILFFIALTTSFFTLNHLDNYYKYLSIAILLLPLIFTIYNAIYEFTSLIHHYLNLKTIKSEFIIASVIHSLINALIHTCISILAYLLFIYVFENDLSIYLKFKEIYFYIFIFLTHFALFTIIGLLSLLLQNLKYLKIILYLLGLLSIAFLNKEILNTIVDFIYNLYTNIELLIKLYLPIILSSSLIWLLITFKIKITNK